MTAILEMATSNPSPGLTESWVNDLPAAEDEPKIPEPTAEKPDAKDTDKALPGHCGTCGELIVREPGSRGRAPKYHPDCRPVRATGTTRVGGRGTRAEAEATEAVAAFQGIVIKGCIMLSMVDRYDAFCVMVALPEFCTNLHGVLLRYEGFRREMLALKGGGSVLALAFSVIMCALPIAAHHGLIPKGQIATVLMNAPFTLHKIQQKMADGVETLTNLMEEQVREQGRAKAEAAAKKSANESE